MQVASRLLLVWGVVNAYPDQTARSPFYSSMLLAWSITEVICHEFARRGASFGDLVEIQHFLCAIPHGNNERDHSSMERKSSYSNGDRLGILGYTDYLCSR